MSERRITNTATMSPTAHLLEMLGNGPARAIERSEEAGQRELVASMDLPTDGSNDPAWEAIGVTFGPPRTDDPIFRPATLPPGWSKVATDHAMHSKLLDDKGRERAGIFYKAAFYDRSASMHLLRRFQIRQNYDVKNGDLAQNIQYRVMDGGAVVFETPVVAVEGAGHMRNWTREGEVSDEQTAACAAWLVEHGYPDWESVTAHWDQP